MAIGDIGSVLASLEFEPTSCHTRGIIHIAGDVYAIAYHDGDYDGWLKTVSISGANLSVIASLEFDTDRGQTPAIIHISGDVYAIAYQGPPWYSGRLKTVRISDDGANLSVIASLEFDTVRGESPNIIHISGNVYAIAYQGPDYDGWLKTVTISDDGNTLALTGSSLEFDTDYCGSPAIIHISGDVYAIAYTGKPIFTGRLKTVTISDDGNTLALTGSSLEFDTVYCTVPAIIHISGDVYAIAYRGPDLDGWLKTVTISNDGNTLALTGSSLEFDTDRCGSPAIIHISGDVYAIAYQGPDYDGWLKTVSIASDGTIGAVIHSLEFDTDRCGSPNIIHISGNVYAIAYAGPDNDGWLKTVEITTRPYKGNINVDQLIYQHVERM